MFCSTEPKPVLMVFLPWQSSKASVTVNCQIEDLSGKWRFYWYKVVPDLSHKTYKHHLLPDSISGTEQDSSIIHGQKRTAAYACRAKKETLSTSLITVNQSLSGLQVSTLCANSS